MAMSEFDKSPMMVNGRVEMFMSSSVLISKWEESEKEMSKVMEKGEKGARRRSRRMDELCSMFEPNGEVQKSTTKSDGAKGKGEGGRDITKQKSDEQGQKSNDIIFGKSAAFENLNSSSPKLDMDSEFYKS